MTREARPAQEPVRRSANDERILCHLEARINCAPAGYAVPGPRARAAGGSAAEEGANSVLELQHSSLDRMSDNIAGTGIPRNVIGDVPVAVIRWRKLEA